jgi:hypothetical protein
MMEKEANEWKSRIGLSWQGRLQAAEKTIGASMCQAVVFRW